MECCLLGMAWRCGECGWRQLRAGQGSGRLRVWSTLVDAWRFHLSSSVRAIGALGTRRRCFGQRRLSRGEWLLVCLLELFFGRPSRHLSRQVTSSVNPRTLQRASAPLLLRKGAGGDAGVARRLFACPLAAGACTDRSRAVTRLAVYVPSGEPPGHSRGCLCPSCARFGAQATSANVC